MISVLHTLTEKTVRDISAANVRTLQFIAEIAHSTMGPSVLEACAISFTVDLVGQIT